MARYPTVTLTLLIAAAGGLGLLAYGHRPARDHRPAAETAPAFVGREACARCHTDEARLWTGSHHDLARQVADDQSERGAFDGSLFTYDVVTSRFYRPASKYHVWHHVPDGGMHEYQGPYTYGVDTLQQNLTH